MKLIVIIISIGVHQMPGKFALLMMLSGVGLAFCIYAKAQDIRPAKNQTRIVIEEKPTAVPNEATQLATVQSSETGDDVKQLRAELDQVRRELERLRLLVDTMSRERTLPDMTPVANVSLRAQEPKPQQSGTQKPDIVVASKAQGGDLSGAGNLLRTDRITIGGYGDFQFRETAISERADGGGTPTFQNTRFVLGIAAVLAEKQNIVFNSELEYEFGSREIDVEQAYVEWRARPEFAFRGGIIVPAIGRFNTFHDSYLNLTTIRPLINQFIVPSAYRDAGIGVRGRVNLPHKMKFSYEANLVNGMQGTNGDDVPTPFSRLLGQSSAAEPGKIAFQAENRRKAVVGRLGFSPIPGLEFGASAYNGHFNKLGDPDSIQQLAEFVAERSPGQDGFYVEGSYQFPAPFAKKLDDGAYVAPVIRYEIVRLDRTIPNFYLNRSRTTLGLNIAPSSTVIFKLNYLFNHTFGPVPQVPAGIGEPLFGISPLPHLGYGRNGFTGSIAYVF